MCEIVNTARREEFAWLECSQLVKGLLQVRLTSLALACLRATHGHKFQ